MALSLSEGFESYDVGAEPYPGLGSTPYVDDGQAHTGTKSLRGEAAEGRSWWALLASGTADSVAASGWARCGPLGLSNSPDLLLITGDDRVVRLGFLPTSAGSPGHLQITEALLPDSVVVDESADALEGLPDWFKFEITWPASGPVAVSVSGAGGTVYSHSFTHSGGTQEGVADLFGIASGEVGVVVCAMGSWWDDIEVNQAAPSLPRLVRMFPIHN